jgi:RNA polymerase sigma factor for flagellar operon FliA
VASRRRLRPDDAEEFAAHVKMKLVESDYVILRKFEGRSSLRTFLTVVIQRLFVDYTAAKWGRWRPSAEARRAGDVGVMLDELLWRDGYSLDEACEILATNRRVSARRPELERIAASLPPRPKNRFETDAPLTERAAAFGAADAGVERDERMRTARRVSAALKRLMARIDPQERLILSLKFVDGHNVADIASMLAVDQKGLYRRLERLLRELRDDLHAEGIEPDEALAIFDDPEISVDW